MKIINFLLLCSLAFVLSYCGGPESPATSAEGTVDGVQVKVDYSSPRVRGREGKIWGDMLPYDTIWRAGANEATVVTFNKPVMVENARLDAGSYSLFMIPTQDQWTVIFNKATDIAGTEYASVKDQNALEVLVTPQKSNTLQEELTYTVTDQGLDLHWEYMTIPIQITAAQ